MNEPLSINAEIKRALSPLGMPVVPAPYTGTERKYITFQDYSNPDFYADDEPLEETSRIYLELFYPLDENPIKTIKRIKRLLHDADFGWPSVTPAHTDDKRRYVFECETSRDINFEETEN